jgi:dimethylaniline monooxygenase (N-oxide forming)
MKARGDMFDCVVVGAGPSGLVCTKELLEAGLSHVVCLEQGPGIGGTFRTGYDNLLLTSSATFSMFSDFWCGDQHRNHFWTKQEAVEYWTRYAEHFEVMPRIRFNSGVAAISRTVDECWQIDLVHGEPIQTRRLALAVGNNSIPVFPEWRDMAVGVETVHSHSYRNAEPFIGRRVLIVGGGESGSDIALEVARVASQCWISLRESTGWVVPRKRGDLAADNSTNRCLWGLPREYGAIFSPLFIRLERERNDPVLAAVATLNEKVTSRFGIWGTYGTKSLGMPQAIVHHNAEVVGGVVEVLEGGKHLKTSDGKTIKDLDAVIFCTGYRNRIGFMPEQLQTPDPRSLYKHMFHSDLGESVVWIGWARPGFGSQFPLMEMQSRLFALVASGTHQLPEPGEMHDVASGDAAKYTAQFEHNAQRVKSLVDYHTYMDDLASVIGCTPPLRKYFWRHPRVWRKLVFGPTQATQFRLRGPGEKRELAHKILASMPVSKFNHVVKTGLRGRVRYALKRRRSVRSP